MTANVSDFLLQRLSDAALSADRPTVIKVIADPDVPPLLPHITLKEAQLHIVDAAWRQRHAPHDRRVSTAGHLDADSGRKKQAPPS